MEQHTFCRVHNSPTTQYPGTWGRNCAYGNRERCDTEAKSGYVWRWDRDAQQWVDTVGGAPKEKS